MASTDFQAQGDLSISLASNYGHLLELDRAGWAREWLRRNLDFANSERAYETRRLSGRSVVVCPESAKQQSLMRWGLHYG